jgi:hypothetical protein
MRRQAWFTLFLAAAFAVGGCSGGGGGNAGIPAPAPAAKKATAVFRIKVPLKHRKGRRAKYISPATQAVTLAFAGPTPVSTTVPLTPATCATTLANLVCTVSNQLLPGTYTASVTTYDSTNVATAHVLSAGQNLAFNVTTGVANNVSLTLSGVPTQLLIASDSGLAHGNAQNGIDLLGLGSHRLIVTALDADGGIIIGPGAPTYAVAQTAGSLPVTITQPGATTPNAFAVTPPGAISSNTATLTVTATYPAPLSNACTQPGAVCTASTVVDMAELIAVMDSGEISVYQAGQTTPLADISLGLGNARAVTFDAAGNLFVANCARGCFGTSSVDSIAEFAPPYSGVPTFITTGVVGPRAIAADASGNVFVANCGSCQLGTADSVTEYSPPFSSGSAPVVTIAGVPAPQTLLVDPRGNLFVASCGECVTGSIPDTVQEFAPPYSGAASTVSTAVTNPGPLAVDSANNLYVGNSNNTTVTIYASPYPLSTPIALNNGNGITSTPLGLAVDSSNDLFVSLNGDKVVMYKSPITFSSLVNTSITAGVTDPGPILLDSLNNLYIGNQGNGTVRTYPQPYSGVSSQLSNTYPASMAILP